MALSITTTYGEEIVHDATKFNVVDRELFLFDAEGNPLGAFAANAWYSVLPPLKEDLND